MNFKELHVHGQIYLRKWTSLIDPIQRWPTSIHPWTEVVYQGLIYLVGEV